MENSDEAQTAWGVKVIDADRLETFLPAMDEGRKSSLLGALEAGSGSELHRRHGGVKRLLGGTISASMDEPVSGSRRRLVATVSNATANLWEVPITDSVVPDAAAKAFAVSSTQVFSPRFGPGYVLYLSSRELAAGLWKMQNGVGTELWRASDGGVTAQPSISPDGKQIALSVLKNGRARLYVTNTDGADRRALADSLATRDSPSWSPDGRVLAVAGYDDKGSGLFLVPGDGGVPIRLYDKVSYLPVWSPDGRYIVFAEYIQGTMMQLRAITPEGKPFPLPDVRLTRTGSRGAMSSPCFTPDGKSLVLLDGEWRKPQFWVVDLQSGRRRQLTELRPGRWSHGFDVSRDGKSILFDRVAENSHVVLIELANRQ